MQSDQKKNSCTTRLWSSGETLMNGAMSGAILKNYVVAELVKSYHNCGKEAFIYYCRDKNVKKRDKDTKEIDIILEGNNNQRYS